MEQSSTSPTTDPTAAASRGRRLGEAGIVFGVGLLAHLALLFAAFPESLPSALAALARPHLLLWALALVVLATASGSVPSSRRRLWYLLAAPAALLLELLVAFGPTLLVSGSSALLALLPWVVSLLAFTGAAAVGVVVASLVSPERQAPRAPAVAVLLVITGWLAVLLLPMQWFTVYFAIWTPAPEPNALERSRYLGTVAAAFLLPIAALVLIRRIPRGGIKAAAGLGIAFAAVFALVFAVPTIDWRPDRTSNELPDDYVPCWGEDCPGG